MLSKIAEWYRIAEIQPSDETINKRKVAITKLVASLLSSKDVEAIRQCVCVSLFGPAQGASFPNAIVSYIKAEQPSFAETLPETAMAIRACSLISLGELVSRIDNSIAVQAASLFLAGFGLRSSNNERHLDLALDQLSNHCRSQMEKSACDRRIPADVSELIDSARESAEQKDGNAETVNSLIDAVEQLSEQSINDREELNLLWWVYRDYSDVAEEEFSSLSPEEAALCAAKEIADLTSFPPPNSVRQLISRLLAKSKSEISIEKLVLKWREKSRTAVGTYSQIPSVYPRLLPLTWICWRWSGKKLPSSWKDEFQDATGVSPTSMKTLRNWTLQVFDEIVALKVVSEQEHDG